MSSDLQCLDSTRIDSLEMPRSFLQQPFDSRLNSALTYVAQEVSGLLQQSHPFSVNRDNNPVEKISIRAIEPEYKFIIAVEPLTDRELEVLELIVDGYSNIAIAEELYITVGTVKTHVRKVSAKHCVQDRTQTAIWALRSGLVH